LQGEVSVATISQCVTPNDNAGAITNTVYWGFKENAEWESHGQLCIECGYTLNSRGAMEVTLRDHSLHLTSKTPPKDPDVLIRGLQRLTPFDFFDPNESFSDTTYLDEDIRIVTNAGQKIGVVRNILLRTGSKRLNALLNQKPHDQTTWLVRKSSATTPSPKTPPQSPGSGNGPDDDYDEQDFALY